MDLIKDLIADPHHITEIRDADTEFGPEFYAKNNATGEAGEMLVAVHMALLGHEYAFRRGLWIDVVVFIKESCLRLQVKSTLKSSRRFGGTSSTRESTNLHGGRRSKGEITSRGLLDYKGKIDAFAFVYLPDPYPYYIHVNAISENQQSLSPSCFTRRGRDDSWLEMVRRWSATKEVA